MAKSKTKIAKRPPTISELKDQLWDLMVAADLKNGDCICEAPEYGALAKHITKVLPPVTVPAFKASPMDVHKMKREVEDSCLSKDTKKAALGALAAAIKTAKASKR